MSKVAKKGGCCKVCPGSQNYFFSNRTSVSILRKKSQQILEILAVPFSLHPCSSNWLHFPRSARSHGHPLLVESPRPRFSRKFGSEISPILGTQILAKPKTKNLQKPNFWALDERVGNLSTSHRRHREPWLLLGGVKAICLS